MFEKLGIIESIAGWQRGRAVRNLAAHDYETDYEDIAEHFNTVHELNAMLFASARRLVDLGRSALQVEPASFDFSTEFAQITACRS